MGRINGTASLLDNIIQICGGDYMELGQALLGDGSTPPRVQLLIALDSFEIYERRAHILWNDFCDQSLDKMERLLGILPRDQDARAKLHEALDHQDERWAIILLTGADPMN